MSDISNNEIVERLDTLIKVTAASVIQGKPFREQVAFLSFAGLQPKDIAEILGKTSNHVSVTLSEIKKQKANAK